MDDCTKMLRTFFQKLAGTLMKNNEGAVLGFNVSLTLPSEPCGCEPVIDCATSHINPEVVSAHGFALDDCNRASLKLTSCSNELGVLDGDPFNLRTEDGDGVTKLTWETDSTNEDGYKIYFNDDPMDPYTFAQVGDVGNGVLEWSDDDYKNGVYYVQGYKGTETSTATQEWGVMVFDLQSNGNGVGSLLLESSETTNMLLTDNANFYDDSDGLVAEGKTRDIVFGDMRQFFLKVPTTETARLVVFNKVYINAVGDSVLPGWGEVVDAPTISINVAYLSLAIGSLVIHGENTISGDISYLPPMLTYSDIRKDNTLSGNLRLTPANLTYFVAIGGSNTINTYTAGKVWAADMEQISVTPAGGSGLSKVSISNLLIDVDDTTWAADSYIIFPAPNETMADTNQGGLWGDFSGAAAPSDVAIALKSLVVTKGVDVQLRDIVLPGGSGDGTGFPAGFGDWYRA